MKDKILTLIIGILIGAILASGGFLIYNKVNSNSNSDNNRPQMSNNGELPQIPSDGEKPEGEPPAKPDGDNSKSPSQNSDKTEQNLNANANAEKTSNEE